MNMSMSRILTGRMSRAGTQTSSQDIPRPPDSQSQQKSPPPRKLQAFDISNSVQGIQLPRAVQETLDDKNSYKPQHDGNFTTIDIFSSPDIGKCSGTPLVRTKSQLHEWLTHEIEVEPGWRNWGMKLVICPAQKAKAATAFPLTMEKDTWKLIYKTMGFSERLTETVRGHNGKYMRFYHNDIEGFMLHGRNPGFSYITTYNLRTKRSYGVVFGLSEDDIKKVTEVIVETKQDLSCWPSVYVAMCLLDRKAGWIEDGSTRSYQALVLVEKQIGTFSDYFLRPDKSNAMPLNELPTEEIVRNLTIISTSISRSEHQCKIAEGMLIVMESAYASYLEHLKTVSNDHSEEEDIPTPLKDLNMKPMQRRATSPMALSVPSTPPPVPASPVKLGFDTSANKHLRNRASELKCVMQVLLLECEFYHRRAEANRQTVYSLIAQKDNSIGLKIASASLDQSNSMKRIAEVNTRDSSAMVIISIVTVIFLPGTFVSSLFSTTIFNFNLENNGSFTNDKWHRIYWAITAPLTLVILSLGILFWFLRKEWDKKRARFHEKEAAKLLGDGYGPYALEEEDRQNSHRTTQSEKKKLLENGAPSSVAGVSKTDATAAAEKMA